MHSNIYMHSCSRSDSIVRISKRMKFCLMSICFSIVWITNTKWQGSPWMTKVTGCNSEIYRIQDIATDLPSTLRGIIDYADSLSAFIRLAYRSLHSFSLEPPASFFRLAFVSSRCHFWALSLSPLTIAASHSRFDSPSSVMASEISVRIGLTSFNWFVKYSTLFSA